ncbi:MAG TPA: YceD family protein, partial [Mycobacteriales bacterium]|nr:YceD family protein [Mycobacteriales bacterium]
RRPGSMRAVRRSVPAPADLGVGLARVPEGAPLELDLRLESVVEGVLVSGTVTAPVTGECARCLNPVTDGLKVDVQELFAYPDSATEETTDEGEVSRLVGDLIDLEPVVRDTLVLALPLSPLCREDCRGLCPSCGLRYDDLPEDHTHTTTDPRWAALRRFGGSTESQE